MSKIAYMAAIFVIAAGTAVPADAKIVARDIKILIDQTDADNASNMGKTHEARIYYDDAQMDPVSHHFRILHEQHTPMRIPFHPDAAVMPVANAWLDLSSKPYLYHLAASPAVEPKADGTLPWPPYAILFDEKTQRMTIRRQSDGVLELSGKYVVGDEVLSGPEIDWVINGQGPPPGSKGGPGGIGPGPSPTPRAGNSAGTGRGGP